MEILRWIVPALLSRSVLIISWPLAFRFGRDIASLDCCYIAIQLYFNQLYEYYNRIRGMLFTLESLLPCDIGVPRRDCE